MNTSLEKTIRHFGSQTALANALDIKPQAVQQWRRVPASRALQVERLTAGAVTAMEILKDLSENS